MRRMAVRIIAGAYIGLPIDGWNIVDGERKENIGSKHGDAADFVFGLRYFESYSNCNLVPAPWSETTFIQLEVASWLHNYNHN